MHHHDCILFAGSSHANLAKMVCQELNVTLGNLHLNQFPDGETDVQILEDVRGCNVFVLQSIVSEPNHFLLELLIIIDALKRAAAKHITAIIPYLGYCRQDRKNKYGVPITSKLVAKILETVGAASLITFDLHADQVEGFFEIPVEHLHCQQLLYDACKKLGGEEEYVVVAPDIGSVRIAENMAKLLDSELVIIKKNRLNASEVRMTLIGSVLNKNVLIMDDLCSTGGTLVAAAHRCQDKGAKKIIAATTHGLFVDQAFSKITSSPLDMLLITDTIDHKESLPPLIKTVSVAPLLAEAIRKMRH